MNKDYPRSWECEKIGDIAEIITGTTPSKNKPEYYGTYIPFVKPPELLDSVIHQAHDNLSKEGARKARVLPTNSILVSCIGNLGKTGITSKPIAFNQQINALVFPKEIEPRFGFYYFQSSKAKNQLESLASATTVAIVNKTKFSTITFPIPPHDEQLRIVAKIEELFTQLDAGVGELRKAKGQLKRYRQAVLKAAVEGELTREWREAHRDELEPASELLERILAERRAKWEMGGSKGKYKEPASFDTIGLPKLPEGWVWASLEQLAWSANYGTSQKCNYEAVGPPVIRIPNINNGRLIFDDLKFATKPDELSDDKAIAPHDLLIIRTNGSIDLIGRSALVRIEPENPYYFASYLIRYRLLPTSNFSQWVSLIWDSHFVRNWMVIQAATTAGQYNVSVSKLNGLIFPLPPIKEQERIIDIANRRLSVADEIEHQLEQGLVRSERLRQSILKQAFEGKLVPQDPKDEPATGLIEQIEAKKKKTAVQLTLMGDQS